MENNKINIKKINVLFATSSQGKKENLNVEYGTTIDELIKLIDIFIKKKNIEK